jgi:hypothetical protein
MLRPRIPPGRPSGFLPAARPSQTPLATLRDQAKKYREKAAALRETEQGAQAAAMDVEAAELYIRANMLGHAEEIGLELQKERRYLQAAQILSRSGAIPFFKLMEHLVNEGNDEMARRIVREYGGGVRGVVKYKQMYRSVPPVLVAAFTGPELVRYATQMISEQKIQNVRDLVEMTDAVGMYSVSAEIYRLLGDEGKQTRALLAGGQYLEAGQLFLSRNLRVEAREVALLARDSRQPMQAAQLFKQIGELRAVRELAACASATNTPGALELYVQSLEPAAQLASKYKTGARGIVTSGVTLFNEAAAQYGYRNYDVAAQYAHRSDILDAALLLFHAGELKNSYAIAEGMRKMAEGLDSEFCRTVATQIYTIAGSAIRARQSQVFSGGITRP